MKTSSPPKFKTASIFYVAKASNWLYYGLISPYYVTLLKDFDGSLTLQLTSNKGRTVSMQGIRQISNPFLLFKNLFQAVILIRQFVGLVCCYYFVQQSLPGGDINFSHNSSYAFGV